MDFDLRLRNQQVLGETSVCFVTFHRGAYHLISKGTGQEETVPSPSCAAKVLYASRASIRLKRLEVRAAIPFDDRYMICAVRHHIEILDTEEKKAWTDESGEGLSVLYFTQVRNLAGFEDGIYFGDYTGHQHKDVISIFRKRAGDIKAPWENCYTFPEESFNHIHNLVPDPDNSRLLILTGDEGPGCGFFEAKDGFRDVHVLFAGGQTDRACVAFPQGTGFLYATDTPMTGNGLYRACEGAGGWERTKIADLAGSCIRGCRFQGNIYLATTVEPETAKERSKFIREILRNRPGPGIRDRSSHLYRWNEAEGLRELGTFRKDAWNMVFFQFGSVSFTPLPLSGALLGYGTALAWMDGRTFLIE